MQTEHSQYIQIQKCTENEKVKHMFSSNQHPTSTLNQKEKLRQEQ